jgi:transposase
MMSASVLDLSWVYSELSPNYPALGRPSIDPVLMIRMLILGYAFGLPNRDSCTAAINNRIRG